MKSFHRAACAVFLLVVLGATPSAAGAVGRTPAPSVPNVQVSHDAFAAHSEPYVAENPQNPNQLVAGSKFFTDPAHYRFKIGTFASTDGGQSWSDGGVLPGFSGYRLVSDVSFAFSPNGSLAYACVLGDNGRRTGIFVLRSRDGGKTWELPVPVFLDPTGAYFNDKPWITVDNSHGPHRGTIYVAWNLDGTDRYNQVFKNSPGAIARYPPGIAVSHSTTYGKTFSTPHVVSRFDDAHFDIGATPQVGPDGQLAVAFLAMIGRGNHPHESMDLVTSADGGLTFSAVHAAVPTVAGLPVHLPHGSFRNLSLPAFAVSPTTGAMLLAWADRRRGEADILKSTSFDGGRTWSIPARINRDHPGRRTDHFQPALAVAPDGAFSCAWFDRRFDPNNRLIDVVAAQSADNGRTFGRNVRVTSASWDPAIDAPHSGGKKNESFIGDYQGLAADNLTVHPLWNDTQNGRTQEIRTSAIPVGAFRP